MKVVSYTALHYGAEYLGYAIRSVIDHVDEHHVLYSPVGSHGHRTEQPCPESRDELYAIAAAAAGEKLRWHEGEWGYEGQQRDSIHQFAPDADLVLVVDADEVWDYTVVQTVLIAARTRRESPPVYQIRLPMIHYWRSFYRAVTNDAAFPIRAIFPQHKEDGVSITWSRQQTEGGLLHHFGYAQTPRIVEYKQHTHGHRNEWRRDIDWFRDRFMANAQEDCHPTNLNYWTPTDVDPAAILPFFMREHPFYRKALIE